MLRKLLFNLWYFFIQPPWDTGISPPELIEFIRSHPAGRALDLGCGTGTNVITLARNGWQAVGVDFAAPAIWTARRKARQAGVEADFHVDDVTRLAKVHGQFDLILDLGCFHNLDRHEKRLYRKNLNRLLRPGGTFLLYGFFKNREDTGPGLLEEDLDLLTTGLHLVDRQDGYNRGKQPSTWMTFEKAAGEVPAP